MRLSLVGFPLRFAIVVSSILVGGTISGAALAQSGGDWTFGTGFDYSNGDYGRAADTSIWYVPNTAQYEFGPWRFKATVPYIRIEGPGGVVGGDGSGIIVGGGSGVTTTQSGLGDVVGQVAYLITPGTPYIPFVELSGKVKFPTADEDKGLGTGEFDYTVQADFFQSIGRITPYVTVGYRFRGDNSLFNLKDGVIASAGAGYQINEIWGAGLSFDFREASTATSEDPKELVPYVTWKAAEDWSVNAYALIGLSDGSPDAGVGLQLKLSVR